MASAGATGHSTVMPAANRTLQRKWDERKHQEHRDRLRRMKPSVDNGPPRNFVHLKQNLRKRQIEEDRWRLVDRHNRELLTRMNTIMHSTGRVDHRNVDWRPMKSLGHIKRQEEMGRVQRENQAILKRIQMVRPQYNVKRWESEYHSHVERTRNLSQLLPALEPSTATRVGRERPRDQAAGESLHLPPIHRSRPETQPSEIQEEIDVET